MNTTTRKTTRGGGKARMAHMAAVMDRVMSGTRARVRAPKALAEHRLTTDQVRDVGSKVALRHIRGKGLGLVARRGLAAHTRIGVYGGKVYSSADHQRLTSRGVTSGKYAVDFYKRTRQGRVRDQYVMDPGVGDVMAKKHANVLAAFINEPAQGQKASVVWVRNYPAHTLELWTTRAVRAGEELTACYGAEYARAYATPCTARPGVMHYIDSGMTAPKVLR